MGVRRDGVGAVRAVHQWIHADHAEYGVDRSRSVGRGLVVHQWVDSVHRPAALDQPLVVERRQTGQRDERDAQTGQESAAGDVPGEPGCRELGGVRGQGGPP